MRTDERCLPSRLLKYLSSILITVLTVLIFSLGAYAMSFTAAPLYPNEDTQVRLQWSTDSTVKYYKIFRRIGEADPVAVTSINVDSDYSYNAYTDTGLSPSTAYHYTIKAYSDEGMHNEIQLTGNAADVTTANIIKPYNITKKYDINTRMVTLTWSGSLAAIDNIIKDGGGNTHTAHLASSITFPESSNGPVSYTISSNDSSLKNSGPSAPVTVTPIAAPVISASALYNGSIISWGEYPYIYYFRLERSAWTGSGWGDWTEAAGTLSEINETDLPPNGGACRYRLAAKESSGYTGWSNISASVNIPKAPTALSCTIVNPNSIALNWVNDPGNTSPLLVMRRQDDGGYLTVANLPYTATSFTDNIAVKNGTTYTYRVGTYNNDTNMSYSDTASVTAAVPAAPTGLVLTASTSSAITLSWNDSNSGEQGYIIERSVNSGSYSPLATVGANVAVYSDTGLTSGLLYMYRVKAFNSFGDSSYSNQVSINTSEFVMPNSLRLTTVSSSQIDLVWTYPGSGSYYTAIERKTGVSGSWVRISVAPSGVLRYSDMGLSSNTQYFYRVRNSPSSGVMTSPYPNNDTGVGAVTKLGGLSLSGTPSSDNTIYLTWSGTNAGDSIVVERKMSNGNFAVLATLNYTATGWYDNTGLVPGAVYTYRIKNKNASNESLYSNEAVVTNFYLNSPSGLTASANPEAGIDLAWKDNSADETGFEIWRRVYGASSYTLYDTVDKNAVKYTDKGAKTGVQYYYMVRAFMSASGIYSGYSNTASIGTGIIGAPTNLNFSYVSNTQGILTWKDTSTNETGFKVERKIGEDGDWTVIVWVSANMTSYTASGLNQYTTYFFRVRAYSNTGSFDSVSSELEVSTALPYAPTEVSATAISSTQVNIKWKDNSLNESGFSIMRKTVSLGYYTAVGQVGPNVTSYSDRGLYSGVAYAYKVVAINAAGVSESIEVGATTGKKVTFSDLSGVLWARESIENLAGRGVVAGKDGDKFRPGDPITKAEFVTMAVKAFKLETTPVGGFADVKVDKPYYREVMTADYYGLISGDDKNMFYPDRPITREEIAMIIFRVLEVVDRPLNGYSNSVLEKYRDKDQISPYAVASMASMIGEGIMSGVSDITLAPGNSATRAEASVYIYKVIDR